MNPKSHRLLVPALILLTLCITKRTQAADAPGAPIDGQHLYDRVTPSLVAVQYVWESELGRQELTGAGVVVSDDGLILTSLSLFDINLRGQSLRVPDEQMKDFKILVPSQEHDADEIEATFQGRDDRSGTAFIKAKPPGSSTQPSQSSTPVKWTPLKFVAAKPQVGDAIYSVGMLGKNAAYKTYLTHGLVSAFLRGEVPHFLVVGGGLAGIGAPVFNDRGEAIGFVNTQADQQPFLHDLRTSLQSLMIPPIFFIPTDDLEQSLKDPPQGHELALPWLGVPQQAMAGLNKDRKSVV